MGNYTVDTTDSLKFIDCLEDRHFGEIDVFRTEDGRFVMRSKRTHIIGEPRHDLFAKIVQWIRRQRHAYVVPVMRMESKSERGICIQVQNSEVYSEYYNFTLLDMLRTKKNAEESELWLILHALLDVSTSARKNKIGVLFNLDEVFITLKGIPCVYFSQFVSLEDSIVNCEYCMGQQIAFILLQLCIGEEIVFPLGESKDLLLFVAKMCTQYKLLGRIVKELLNREKNQYQAFGEIETLLQKKMIEQSKEIKLNKFRYAVPQCSDKKERGLAQEKEQNTNNPPVQFKKRKASNKTNTQNNEGGKDIYAKNKVPLTNSSSPNIRAKDIISRQEQSQRLGELQRRKEENRQRMQKFTMKKQMLCQKQNNHSGFAVRQKSGPKKTKERRVNEVSRPSFYR